MASASGRNHLQTLRFSRRWSFERFCMPRRRRPQRVSRSKRSRACARRKCSVSRGRTLERRRGFIEISAGKAKTAQRRLIPISPNLAQWLAVLAAHRRKCRPHSKPFLFEAMRNATAKANIAWKANGLRHSFITYRLAATKDVAEVALEAGNSPTMIFKHYRELATEEDAAESFGISCQTCSQHRWHDGMKRSSPVSLSACKAIGKSKAIGGPEAIHFRRARGDEGIETLQAEEHAREEAARKASLRKDIRTYRQKLQREASLKGCTPERKKEIKADLEDLRGLEEQEFGSELASIPLQGGHQQESLALPPMLQAWARSWRGRLSSQGLRSKKPHLMLAKLAEQYPKKWGGVAEREKQAVKREAKHNPRIERTRKRIKYGEIKEVAGSKLSNVDREIAEHYFKSQRLRKPLRELSAEKASVEVLKLDVDISPDSFDRALRRLALVG